MKQMIKNVSYFVVLLLLFMNPSNTKALTQSTFYNIEDPGNLQVDTLNFSDMLFIDNSKTSTQSFGLTGKVYNQSNQKINYNITVSYYDSDYNLLATSSTSLIAISGINQLNHMSKLSILGTNPISKIRYYQLSIQILDNISSSNSKKLHQMSSYSSYDYLIDQYHIDIIVNENNTLDITETIDTYFNVNKHGIFRTIPLQNEVTRLDGTSSKNRTQISNISVSHDYKTSKENGNMKLQIGSINRMVIGEEKYIIKYTYNLGKDPVKEYDEFYYNIIGTDWDTAIGNVTFSITMPKKFDASKLGFSSGMYSSTDNRNVKYNVNDKTITGEYQGILEPKEALTIRCELPEGYFVDAGLKVQFVNYVYFLVPILFLGVSYWLWYKFGRDDLVVETVEFYPPEGLNSLDIGFLYKGEAVNKDVTSLLLYLANKGYIQIIDKKIDLENEKINLNPESIELANQKIVDLKSKIEEEKQKNPDSKKIKYYENMLSIYKDIDKPIDYSKYGVSSSIKNSNKKNNYMIRKIKDYDGNNPDERKFMEGLFEQNRTEVTEDMLYNEFYITNNIILHHMNQKKNKDKVFEKTSRNKSIWIILMIIITYCTITIPPVLEYGEWMNMPLALVFPILGYSAICLMILTKGNLFMKIFGFLWGASFFSIGCLMMIPILIQYPIYLVLYIIGLLCIFFMFLFVENLPKRTPYGNEMLGKIKGFKTFLENVEKEKLEAMVMENPLYFYDILPYTYVLNISDKWIKKFETISIVAPTWYDSTSSFDVDSFATFITHTMNSAQYNMSSSPSSGSSDFGSSSSSSTGGGSSGGGSGGGGGGSW